VDLVPPNKLEDFDEILHTFGTDGIDLLSDPLQKIPYELWFV